MDLFYVEHISNKKLSVSESKHCLTSLRKKVNQKILLTEGKGITYSAMIESIQNGQVIYTNIKSIYTYLRKPKIHIAIAPTKNKARFEWFLEKATEIGVDIISPLICQYSERNKINETRAKKILISAMKQSKNPILPTLNSPISFEEMMKNPPKNCYIAHCQNRKKIPFKKLLVNLKNPHTISLFIGPEGDFSEKELNFAEKIGFVSITLGEQRLRTETAGIVGCNMINLLL